MVFVLDFVSIYVSVAKFVFTNYDFTRIPLDGPTAPAHGVELTPWMGHVRKQKTFEYFLMKLFYLKKIDFVQILKAFMTRLSHDYA